jgi:drug/metabolite transporter (DMT)-like permease
LLYTALAGGTMGVVAPVTGVTSALVPVAWGLVQGEHPSAVALVGVALALGAVALAASPARAATDQPSARATGVPLAFAAGLCFGTILVLLSDVDPADGMWPLVAWRCVSMSLAVAAVVLVRPRPRPNRPAVGLAAITGVLEMVANGVYILAAREGLLSLVGVLGSLYPISTVLLARFLLHERLDRRQELGLVCALGGLSLIAAG